MYDVILLGWCSA